MSTLSLQTCAICELQREEGIRIASSFICSTCEYEMVKTDVLDEKYPYFITQMRHIFFERNA